MPRLSITVEALAAGYGDCILVSCPVGRATWRVLVDTGPDETWPVLRQRLSEIAPNSSGHRHIDLVIISHIDHDHIGGAQQLFSDRTLNLTFGDVWFNGRRHLGARSVAEGQGLVEVLGTAANQLSWNRAFDGDAAVVSPDIGFREIRVARGRPRLTLLGPTSMRLRQLAKLWDSELARLHRRERSELDLEAPAPRGQAFPNLEALAASVTATDRGVPNGSSIAVLLEHQGKSVLLGADAFPTDTAVALAALAKHRGINGPVKVDAFKVNHHGSRANLTAELLKCVQARHYIVSSDNAIFGLPNDEALARIALHGGPNPTIWFNYGTERNRRWLSPEVCERFGYNSRVPTAGTAGITVLL